MTHIQWSESMSVGVPQFDEHHLKLIQIINNLVEFTEKGMGKFVIFEILDELFQYAKYHFLAEEKFMLDTKCPNYEMHQIEHDNFVLEITKLSNQCRRDYSEKLIQDLCEVLKSWLTHHILEVDKAYGKYYKPPT